MPEASRPLRVLVYSDNPRTREQVQLALGKRVHPDLPELTYVEVATGPMVIAEMDKGGFDLAILDGEATPVGGLGIAKQLKDELDDCPPLGGGQELRVEFQAEESTKGPRAGEIRLIEG